MKTGILVHGRHLQAIGWERLVWGEPPHKLGSLPMMIRIALMEGLDNIGLVVFGTGASEKDGLKEAEYTKRFLLNYISDLDSFDCLFDGLLHLPSMNKIRDFCHDKITLELRSQDTTTEVRNAARLFAEAGCEKIYQVSCGSHIMRCLKESLTLREKGEIPREHIWLGAPDDMAFARSSVADVAILEPPHRGDDPMVRFEPQLYQLVPQFFKLSVEQRKMALADLQDFINKYK